MNKITLIILASLLIILFSTCKKEPDIPDREKIEMGNNSSDSITYSSAVIFTQINKQGDNKIQQHGHCWSLTPGPVITNSKTTLGELTDSELFTSHVMELVDNSTYYIRPYVTYNQYTEYGSELEITTKKLGVATIQTTDVSNIGIISATFSSVISSDSGSLITSRGFCWDTKSNITIEDCLDTTITGNGTGYFTANVANLHVGETYFVTAYAINSKGTVYGEVKQFTTINIDLPVVQTGDLSDITYESLKCTGTVESDGGGSVTSRGFCWNTTGNPTLEDNKGYTIAGTGTGGFYSEISELSIGTRYYINTYATNEKGTAYGQAKEFNTLELPCGMYTITYEGQVYNTVEIGEQCWFKENLNYETGNSWCYEHDEENCITYGRLYDWETLMNGEEGSNTIPSGVQGICPDGWHIPGDDEWKILESFVDTYYDATNQIWHDFLYRGFDVGKRLKTISGWDENTGTDAYGFSALPGGYIDNNGEFKSITIGGHWWSATDYNSTDALSRFAVSFNDYVSRNNFNMNFGFSVRCLKDNLE